MNKCQESHEVNTKKFIFFKHKDQKMNNGHLSSKVHLGRITESMSVMLLFNALVLILELRESHVNTFTLSSLKSHKILKFWTISITAQKYPKLHSSYLMSSWPTDCIREWTNKKLRNKILTWKMTLTVQFVSLKWIRLLKILKDVELVKNISTLSVFLHGKSTTLHVLFVEVISVTQELTRILWESYKRFK